jgi:hypothetical protein
MIWFEAFVPIVELSNDTDICGVIPPLELTGERPVTLVTVPTLVLAQIVDVPLETSIFPSTPLPALNINAPVGNVPRVLLSINNDTAGDVPAVAWIGKFALTPVTAVPLAIAVINPCALTVMFGWM